ncbi:hypothetical protein M3Y99_00961300 [Aphelenchoides fujianensis]|nr:hypothetical protein M3Y99_00961300 [Aphelenchoides fujianensis]
MQNSVNWRFFFVLLLAVLPAVAQLVLKACCNGDKNCETFQRPEEMFGVSCCGLKPINDFEHICCSNVTRHRKVGGGFVDRCCGNDTLNYDQTCCQGIVFRCTTCQTASVAEPSLILATGKRKECWMITFLCLIVFSMDVLCCNGTLNRDVEPGTTCCGSKSYDGGIHESCCGGQVSLKELFDGCCPVLNSEPPEYKQFNSRTHLCCDVPIQRDSNMKCCYLRNQNGTFTPKSYDYSTSCCAYPFQKITPKTGDSCVAAAPKTEDEDSTTTTTTRRPGRRTTTPEE